MRRSSEWARIQCMALAIAVAGTMCAASRLEAQQAASPAPPAAPATQPAPAAPAAGQTPTGAEAPAVPAAPAKPALPFDTDAGLLLFTVKPEAAADFEAFFAKVKEAMATSDKPEYKQMASGWRMYKVAEPAPPAPPAAPNPAMYVMVIDPAVKGVDYDPRKILLDVMPTDEPALAQKFVGALVNINKLDLVDLMHMGSM